MSYDAKNEAATIIIVIISIVTTITLIIAVPPLGIAVLSSIFLSLLTWAIGYKLKRKGYLGRFIIKWDKGGPPK